MATAQRDNATTKIKASLSYETDDTQLSVSGGNGSLKPRQKSTSRSPVKKTKKGVTKLVNKVLEKLAKDSSVKRLEDGRPLLKEKEKSKSSLKKMFKSGSSSRKLQSGSKKEVSKKEHNTSAITVISLVNEEAKVPDTALFPDAKKHEHGIENEDAKSDASPTIEDEKDSSNCVKEVVSQLMLRDEREAENEGIPAEINTTSDSENESVDGQTVLIVRTVELSLPSDLEVEEENTTAFEETKDEEDKEDKVQNLYLAVKTNVCDNNGDGEWVSFDGSLFSDSTDTQQQLDQQLQSPPIYKRPGFITVVLQILILVIALFYGLVYGSEIYSVKGQEHQPSQSNGLTLMPQKVITTAQHTTEEGPFE